MSKTKRAVLLVVGLVGGTLLVVGCILMPWIIPVLRHEALKSSAKRFLSEAPTQRDTSEGAYIRGKVIVLDVKAGAMDPVQNRLPDEIRAYGEGEVGTVILLDWDFKSVEGGDWGKVTSHYSTCKLTIIDRQRNVIVGEKQAEGASSPVSTGAGRGAFRAPAGTMTARRANDAVVGLIKSLPRR
jgi:hypothetical protein